MSSFAIFVWVWSGSTVAAGIIGHARQAAIAGAVLGLFLGPIGVVAAFALDGRDPVPIVPGDWTAAARSASTAIDPSVGITSLRNCRSCP